MEQQQMDEKFMSDNGWQCAPYTSYPIHSQAIIMKRDKNSEDNDSDSDLVKAIKRLRRNKINCQPFPYLDVKIQAVMIKEKLSLNDVIHRMREKGYAVTFLDDRDSILKSRFYQEKYGELPVPQEFTSAVAVEAAAAQDGRSPPSSPIPIPSRKKGGKKRSYKKRTNAKKRSTKKRTNAKKRSYKKRN
jgi:hypothetical protein